MVDPAAKPPKNEIPVYRALDAALRTVLRILPLSRLTESIALWWGYRFRPALGITKLRSGSLISLTRVDHLQLLLHYLGTFEPQCLSYMYRCVRTGATILDVGANIGFYTLEAAAAVGPSGRVIAIEAAPFLANSVRENVRLNQIKTVTVITAAAGDVAGDATLILPRGGHFGEFTLGNVSGDETFTVSVRRIDDLLARCGIGNVDFIKMDIEGSEYRALKGAQNTLSKCHPSILIELNEPALNWCGSSAREVKEFLFQHGYRGWLIEGKSLKSILTGQEQGCDECECLFVHHENSRLIQELSSTAIVAA